MALAPLGGRSLCSTVSAWSIDIECPLRATGSANCRAEKSKIPLFLSALDARFLTELAIRIHANRGFCGDSTQTLGDTMGKSLDCTNCGQNPQAGQDPVTALFREKSLLS